VPLKANLPSECNTQGARIATFFGLLSLFINPTKFFSGRNSADVFESQSHSSNDGRNSPGNSRGLRSADAGNARARGSSGSRAGACNSPSPAFHVRSHGSAAMAATGDL
jgi:hypothetical protein